MNGHKEMNVETTGGADATFSSGYVSYWKRRVAEPTDGTRVADAEIAGHFIEQMDIQPAHRVLDMGCGFGRLFPVLSLYSPNIIGIDVSRAMIEDAASRHSYACLVQASAEETRLPGEFMDRIVCWATFDVMEQEAALIELNRILKTNGLLLITGKNRRYRMDDEKAFIAERNARLKNFPNHFTDVASLFNLCPGYGFQVEKGYAFERRGDFGEKRSADISNGPRGEFYEFLLVLRKTGISGPTALPFCHEFSDTARQIAESRGSAESLDSFFAWHKATHES